MSAQELALWSMALGAIAALAVGRVASFVRAPSAAQAQGAGYHAAVLALVLLLSGVAGHFAPAVPAKALHVAQVLAGPFCVGVSDLWIRRWLYAPQRDRLMASALRLAAVLLPAAGLAALALPAPWELPAAAAISLIGGSLTLWLAARAWLLGDALAPVMAAGCLFTLPAIAGLYAVAMQWPLAPWLQGVFALCAALSNALTGLGLWQRERQEARARRHPAIASTIDPVTRLRSGRTFVHKLLRAQRRRVRSGRDGGMFAVLVFDIERVRTEAGTAGVNELYIGLASRIQRQVGSVNIVGRYYEGCFVVLVESIPSTLWLRTLALRLATALRRPMVITLRSGERAKLAPDIGVGVVHLSSPAAAVEDILADGQRMAMAARAMRSRAAIRDPRSGQVVAIELAHLGSQRQRRTGALRSAA
ncbi:GGDEF domain-containing protein [Ramlibacter sp.]|uniref:GGDEF domain-containing protein n=1 Tax=Ramlibacter sp. TaxID=1917967 RepID=UPI002CB87B6D|nr:GGDEF domain-containing protein [Ramlibacter sp.]HWI84542.1 GGDEF domain-containing protein [Ramlibacter sp.]